MTGWRRIAIAIVFAACVVYAWMRWASPPTTAALPVLPEGVRYQALRWTADDWLREGYVEMVSPIRPPSSDDGRTRIAVYVRFPAGKLIRAVRNGEDWTLEVPEGTSADRVEFYGGGPIDAVPISTWRVLDVRGISFEPSGQELRVLRPKGGDGRDLFGVVWPRGDKHLVATAALGELVLRGLVAAPARSEERERAAAHLRALNDCPSCHVPQQTGRRTERDPGIVNRGTDASGLFQVTSILRDRLPFETYRPRDTNQGDPFITRFCNATRVDDGTVRCPDSRILEGKLDVLKGMSSGDRHTQRVCESRRALAQSLEEGGRDAFHDALAECGVLLP